MRLEPHTWSVAFVGCLYDWILTRSWGKVLRGLVPLFVLLTVVGLVTWGHWMDRDRLAAHYMELGNKEVADWQSQWSLDEKSTEATTDSNVVGGTESTEPAEPTKAGGDAESKEQAISPFAETLFRRAQQLHSGDQRSAYFVAMSLAQKGLTQQAVSMLRRIAPDSREGFLPAHAWLAEKYTREAINQGNLNIVLHHCRAAMKWNRSPAGLLARFSELFLRIGDQDSAVKAMKLAAERDPRFSIALAKLSRASGNKLLAEEHSKKAEEVFVTRTRNNPTDVESRLLWVESLVAQNRLDEAEKAVREGLNLKDAPEMRRALSEIYRIRFVQTTKVENGQWSGMIEMLDQALRIDPSNPLVSEEVAKLARIGGRAPGEQLMNQLRTFLAEGKATPTTHAWIAELYLVREDHAAAIPHLEQVVERLPTAAHYLNNLAWVLAELHPDRRNEAMALVDKAISLAPRAAEFYDTRGFVLTTMNRDREAIAAFESAIELQPQRDEFHLRVAEAYKRIGESKQAELHLQIAKRIADQRAAALAAAEKASKDDINKSEQPANPTPEATTPTEPASDSPKTTESPASEATPKN
ncbi:MAG: hypothetical protein U0892_22435 [Pirellulales bacterium]